MVPTPNYVNWCDRSPWTMLESLCLAMEIDPDTPWIKDPDAFGGVNPLMEAFEQYQDLASEALAFGILRPYSDEDLVLPLLQRRVYPSDFLRWAQSQHIPFPQELLPVLTRNPARRHPETPSALHRVPQHPSPQTANSSANPREQVLGAALAALKRFPGRCSDVTGLRRAIEDNAPQLWPETHKPPLPADEIENLLGRWLARLS